MHLAGFKKDKEAFNTLFFRYKHLALGICFKYLSDLEQARDAIQNIFLQIWDEGGRTQISRFKPWFYKVVRNHCLMILRKGNIDVDAEMFSEHEVDEEEWIDYLPLTFKEEELLNRLYNCIEELSKEQQHCIRDFYLEEKSYEEIALQTGYPNKEVKDYIQNGRKNMMLCVQSKKKI